VDVDIGITCDLIDDVPKVDVDIGITCDLLDMSCSSNVDSCMNDSPCDPLLNVKNHGL
jgi:hypothetical protein